MTPLRLIYENDIINEYLFENFKVFGAIFLFIHFNPVEPG